MIFQLLHIKGDDDNQKQLRLYGRDNSGTACHCIIDYGTNLFFVSLYNGENNTSEEKLNALATCHPILFNDLKIVKVSDQISPYSLYKIETNKLNRKQVFKFISVNIGEEMVNGFYYYNDIVLQYINHKKLNIFDWIKVEYVCDDSFKVKEVVAVNREGNAIFKILSIDIEVEIRDENTFPHPDNDRVIVIACMVQSYDSYEYIEKTVFVLRSCSTIAKKSDVKIRCFHEESELLIAFSRFLKECDPDIVTGYNIKMFDLYYIFNRCKKLSIDSSVFDIGKMSCGKFAVKESAKNIFSRYWYEKYDISLPGRIVFDVFPVIMQNYNLQCYKLNYVSNYFLKDSKNDVSLSEITKLFNGTKIDRGKLADHCLKGAKLPLQLIQKLNLLTKVINICRRKRLSIEMFLEQELHNNNFNDANKKRRKTA